MKTKIAIALLLFLSLAIPSTLFSQERLRLATTTSVDNSGILRILLPPFEEKFGVKVDVLAVGTGKALKLGENGDVDAVLVHAPEDEEAFVAKGFGVDRRSLMYNDFVIVGPPPDPAGIGGLRDAVKALKMIAGSESKFISRGDLSGTHKRELSLWRELGTQPSGKWYMESGLGMGASLTMASEMGGYALTDEGTYLSMKDKLELKTLVEEDERLYNPYSVMAVNPERYPHVNYKMAERLIEYLTSEEGQRLIAGYTTKGGDQLFHPLIGKTEE